MKKVYVVAEIDIVDYDSYELGVVTVFSSKTQAGKFCFHNGGEIREVVLDEYKDTPLMFCAQQILGKHCYVQKVSSIAIPKDGYKDELIPAKFGKSEFATLDENNKWIEVKRKPVKMIYDYKAIAYATTEKQAIAKCKKMLKPYEKKGIKK